MSSPQVLNARDVGKSREGAIYIGRPSKWGNPFAIKRGVTREDVIRNFDNHLKEHPYTPEELSVLTGKDLICWCAPLPCHGDILLKLANP